MGWKAKPFYYLLFALITVIVLIPMALVVFAAFKPTAELSASSPLALPKSLYFGNLEAAFVKGNILTGFRNTAVLIAVSVGANMVLGTMTAYILNRFDFRFRKLIFAMFTVAMIVPYYTTEVARFQIIKGLGLYDTLMAPILIYAGTDLLQIFIFLQFMEKISVQLDESAMMDGASYFRIFRSITFPLMLPAAATLAIIKVVEIMNDMYIPFLYMPDKDLHTLSTALMTFVGERATFWNELSAAILIVMLPAVLIYLFFQRYVFAGLMDGAVKG
ncbi:ABC transporter permease subunit [Cohnella sp. CFH 77786]|uniref:carbohydrate ABC transporter permease n=1 Tax=Cohnella sp. CFH 77786 TaxID=2662265 RepID=UPI001C610687|nr:carbohydrate ABC transporter permease [Cohnella sp. CFH 77786]MBW5449289.1 ABC transporter permease subunit [Cohnella sp. CFH 77786]